MKLRLMTLEVDGGFSNPIVLRSMAIWLSSLLAFLIPGAVYLVRRAQVAG